MWAWLASNYRGTAVDGDDLPGDVARGAAREQHDESLEVRRLAELLQRRCLEYARREGIYQPGPEAPAPEPPERWPEPPVSRPRKRAQTPGAQLTLF